jgi:hypothetical protein
VKHGNTPWSLRRERELREAAGDERRAAAGGEGRGWRRPTSRAGTRELGAGPAAGIIQRPSSFAGGGGWWVRGQAEIGEQQQCPVHGEKEKERRKGKIRPRWVPHICVARRRPRECGARPRDGRPGSRRLSRARSPGGLQSFSSEIMGPMKLRD